MRAAYHLARGDAYQGQWRDCRQCSAVNGLEM